MNNITTKVLNIIDDKKINSKSFICIMNVSDYKKIIQSTLLNDELTMQRGKETRKKEVYKRLREDLKVGTVFPPISLALREDLETDIKVGDIIEFKEGSLYVLDGLQRTLALIDAIDELENDETNKKRLLESKVRFEIWINASLNSLLYKMVVLNSGQTPMSLRHQIEILNKPFIEDFKKTARNLYKVTNIDIFTWREKNKRRTRPLQYLLSDLIETFLSFAEGKPFVDKNNLIVEQIEKIDFLDKQTSLREKYENKELIFEQFVYLLTKLDVLLCEKYTNEEMSKRYRYKLGNNLMKSKPFLAGFFSSFGKLLSVNYRIYEEKRDNIFELLRSDNDDPLYSEQLSVIMEDLRSKSKRFGDTERTYFSDAFKIYINSRNTEIKFDEIWAEAIPTII
ncbi:MAG: hypothetical protein KAW92_08170 [Candidatus Cloacimonetes bacterium]|nr:hypothetical protein [Candidatus Cloacimonadota bacterium]